VLALPFDATDAAVRIGHLSAPTLAFGAFTGTTYLSAFDDTLDRRRRFRLCWLSRRGETIVTGKQASGHQCICERH
jgi:hypothetical protein